MVYAVTPWNNRGLALLDTLRKEMDQFFGENNGAETTPFFAPRTNLAETESQYEVLLDLPGIKPENFEIELKDGQLWISGRREAEKEEKGKVFHRVERYVGQFRRVITLGGDVDADNIEAEYKDGVLRLTVPKAEAARPKRIEVKS